MTSQKIFGTSISVAITFGPDVCKAAQGKISGNQLLKNSVVSGGSILAAKMVGEAIGEGLLGHLGAMVAGAAVGFVVKKLLDEYTEDDAITMFRYLKEEFIDVVMQINLSSQEREEIVAETIGYPQLHELLQQMYMSGEYRRFAREAIVESAVVEVLSRRENITDDMIQNGFTKFITGR